MQPLVGAVVAVVFVEASELPIAGIGMRCASPRKKYTLCNNKLLEKKGLADREEN